MADRIDEIRSRLAEMVADIGRWERAEEEMERERDAAIAEMARLWEALDVVVKDAEEVTEHTYTISPRAIDYARSRLVDQAEEKAIHG